MVRGENKVTRRLVRAAEGEDRDGALRTYRRWLLRERLLPPEKGCGDAQPKGRLRHLFQQPGSSWRGRRKGR